MTYTNVKITDTTNGITEPIPARSALGACYRGRAWSLLVVCEN